jgi:hypothetical protein
MDHSKFDKAAQYIKREAKVALKAKALKEYQLAIFLGCLSNLVGGDLESAEKLHSSIRDETGVSINLEAIGDLVEVYCDAARRVRFNKQRLQQALNLLDTVKLRESELKLAKKMAKTFEQQAATRVQLRVSYHQAWVGDPIQVKGILESPMKIKILKSELISDLFKTEIPPLNVGEFSINAIPSQTGEGKIGPLKLICQDTGGRRFPIESNVLDMTIKDVKVDLQIRLQPTTFPRATPTDLLLTVINAGDSVVTDLDFQFSFSPEIEVTLGSPNKRFPDLLPSNSLEFSLTVMGKKTGEGTISVKYSFIDAKNVTHKKKGKVKISIEKKTRTKKT